jgi:hypothetical protein
MISAMGAGSLVLGALALRRLLRNYSDQKARQMAKWASEPLVEHLPTGVACNLRRQMSEQPSKSLGAMALQGKEVLQLVL